MLSNQLKEVRTQKGYSQELLAEKAGLSLRTIQRVENGETQPRGDTFMRLTEALDVAPTEILEWKKKEDKTYLSILNLSALSFILFPLLGIILPLILWLTKRDQIKGVNDLGKLLMNFQITWSALLFLSYIGYFIWFINYVTLVSPTLIILMYAILGVFYIYNFCLICFNAYRISKEKSVWYYPRINLIR